MTIDLDQLEARAKAATPGPWEDMSNHPDHLYGAVNKGNKHIALCNHYESAEPTKTVTAEEMLANAAFIAAANPAVVLELVAELRKARTERDWVVKMVNSRLKFRICPTSERYEDCHKEPRDALMPQETCRACWLKAARDAVEEL